MTTPKRRPGPRAGGAPGKGGTSRGGNGARGGDQRGRAPGGIGGVGGGTGGGRSRSEPSTRASGGRSGAGRGSAARGSATPRGEGRPTGGDRSPRPARTAGGAAGPSDRRARSGRADDELGGEQVEGRQAVRELLRANRRAVHQVLVAEGLDVTDDQHPLAEILELAERRGVPVRRVPRGRIDAEAGTEAPQGVLARADPVRPVELEQLMRRSPDGTAPFLVVLDGVTDPHNLGAVMRTALGAGATGIVVGRHRAAHLSPTAVKAAAGAVEHLAVGLVTGVPAALAELKTAGVWTVGLDAGGSGTVWDLGVATEAVALVLGAEGRGLSRLAAQRCDLTVGIPLAGPLGSLNVSAAAAVACFEVARRRG